MRLSQFARVAAMIFCGCSLDLWAAEGAGPTGIPLEPPAEPAIAVTAPADTTPSKPASDIKVSHETTYIDGLGTYTITDSKRGPSVKHADGAQFMFGHQASNHFGYELGGYFDTLETGGEGGSDFYRQGIGADVFYALGDRRGLTPFILLGGGADHNDIYPATKSSVSWYANAGLGLVSPSLFASFPIKLRAEARYVYDGWDSAGDVRVGLGLEWSLSEIDTYHEAGKSEPIRVVEVQTGLQDSDGDGVIDQYDQCPNTALHTRVDGQGCPLPKILELKGLHFEFNKARILPDGETILTWAAGILKKYPDMQVEVAGYADAIGSADYNLKLSQERAQAVKDYLIGLGVAATQMSVHGYGKSEPAASNDTDAGRERNRRVELRILN